LREKTTHEHITPELPAFFQGGDAAKIVAKPVFAAGVVRAALIHSRK